MNETESNEDATTVIQIDATRCQAYGSCSLIDSDVFVLDDWGYAKVSIEVTAASTLRSTMDDAIKACPAKAIRWVAAE